MKTSFVTWSLQAISMSVLSVGLIACETPLEQVPPRISQEQLFWSFSLNHKAITLSTTAPYDTITLSATAKNVDGVPLPNQPAIHFIPSGDLAVSIDTNGVVRARDVTGSTGIRIIATMTYHGVTRADTAYVKVTAIPAPKPIHTLTLGVRPGDSTVIAASAGFADLRSKALRVSAYDDAGDPIDGIIAYYWANNQWVLTNRQTGLTQIFGAPGTVVIHAAATVYGRLQQDSLVLTITDPLLGVVRVTNPKQSDTTTIMRGGDIVWLNAMLDSLDIVFDDPTTAHLPIGTTALAFMARDSTGNIGLFPGDLRFDFFRPNLEIIRSRHFPTSGEYHYRSMRYPNVTGVIRVK